MTGGAGIRSANLSGADLSGAKLRSAVLENANLQGADLQFRLEAADLTGARYHAHTRWPAGFDRRKQGAVMLVQ